jgi:hypothetical protein
LGKACEANLVGLLEYAIHNVRVMIQQLKMAAAMQCLALLRRTLGITAS